MKTKIVTLIAARPGRMRDSLGAMLAAMPQIDTMIQADSDAAALQMIKEQHPALVLLDTNLYHQECIPVLAKRVSAVTKQIPALVEQIKAQQPETRCLVLADNIQQQLAAGAAGANGVLLKGFSTATLLAAIHQVLGEA